jgi:FMN reductase
MISKTEIVEKMENAAVARPPGRDHYIPTILGIGGTLSTNSTSERALGVALDAAREAGANIDIIPATELNLPIYNPEGGISNKEVVRLISAVRQADGIIIASPGYHGGMSGLLKNALDYLQETANDPAPYLHNKAAGCIVSAAGWQAGVTTLSSLRSTIHALRGWPTPLGVVINSSAKLFGPDGHTLDAKLESQLATVGRQVTFFARACSEILRNAA